MKVTLRKAHALQQEIRRELDERMGRLRGSIRLDETVQDVPKTLTQAQLGVSNELHDIELLSTALSAIRAAVADANTKSGVSSRLAEVAHINRMMKAYAELQEYDHISIVPAEDLDAIQHKLTKLAETDSRRSLYREPEVTVSLLSEDVIRDNLAQLRRSRAEFNDELLERNVSTRIELSDGTVAVLRARGLID